MGEPANDRSTDPRPTRFVGMDALIGIGAGVGVVFGVLLDSIAMGLAFGAGSGTVAGVIRASHRRGQWPMRPPC